MLTKAKKLIALAASATLMLSACLRLPPTEATIPTVGTARDNGAGRTLIVMLPGMGDRAKSFVSEEFFDIAQERGYDTIAVDAHLGYYRERSLVSRLQEDVIEPAQAQGYDNIWLLGISMGGFGALYYAQARPDDIAGLILLAPWLGGDEIVNDILAAESLGTWTPGEQDFPTHEIDVWRWLQAETSDPHGKPIVLAYGNSDRLAGAYSPLLERIPDANVYTRNGGHKWTTWRPLWTQIAGSFKTQAAP
ncbi:MAG: lysophospholipase [Gammaproteobacteria bacterium]|nr:lysophospholipase [Gammaproteobacteria bacterium]